MKIYKKSELTKDQIADLIMKESAERIGRDDWDDEDAFKIEKAEAIKVGVKPGETFFVTK